MWLWARMLSQHAQGFGFDPQHRKKSQLGAASFERDPLCSLHSEGKWVLPCHTLEEILFPVTIEITLNF